MQPIDPSTNLRARPSGGPLHELIDALTGVLGPWALACVAGAGVAILLRHRDLRWTWAVATVPLGLGVSELGAGGEDWWLCAAGVASVLGARWQRYDRESGGDLAQRAAERLGPVDAIRAAFVARARRVGRHVARDGLVVGVDARGGAVHVPLGDRSGSHLLVVGATGSGKTVTQALVAVRAVEQGHGAIVIDPKGDAALEAALRRVARERGRRFVQWTPEGPSLYNPYARGSDTEIADKALAGERYSEPHYLRQAQRYLGHAVRTLRAAGAEVSLAALVRSLDPVALEVTARGLPEAYAAEVCAYLDSLSARQRRDLGGTRDRLAILAESDVGRWLEPGSREGRDGPVAFDLLDVIAERAVAYFRLDADRRPLAARMLGAALVQDLLTTAAYRQQAPVPTLAVIDEFSALASEHVARLFGRARSAGISIVLGTQELSDLRAVRTGLLEQVLGNVGAVIAHRQVVPDSADLVAGVAGTRGGWVVSERVEPRLLRRVASGGTRARVREYLIHPDQVKTLPVGCAAVIVPSGRRQACIARIRSDVAEGGR